MVQLMSFFKLLNLARVYDKFGSFIRMVEISLVDSIPFITAYVGCLIFFAMGYESLEADSLNEPGSDGQPGQAQGLGRFGRLIFSLWRTYLFYVDVPTWRHYDPKKEDTIQSQIHMQFIWIFFMASLLFMSSIMLNFMIGVIFETYLNVTAIEQMYIYRGRALLNIDYFQLKQYF